MNKHLEISVWFDEYDAEKAARKSLTVGELAGVLSDLDPDQHILLSDYSGYTVRYGAVLVERMTDHSRDDEDEEEGCDED